MTLIEKSRKAKVMRIANVIAKQLTGSYKARISIALKMAWKNERDCKINNLDVHDDANRGFDSYLYAFGLHKYWDNTTSFYLMSDNIMDFIKTERLTQI
jgi:hypothetical protein